MAGERTRDWSCDECGMVFAEFDAGGYLAEELRGAVARWRGTVADLDDAVRRRRPDEDTWSVAEYSGHIGDVLDWMVDAIGRMRSEDHPTIRFFDPDRRAREERYNDRAWDELAAQVERSGMELATVLEELGGDELAREATFGWGDRDVLDMARNATHEGVHHTHDVARVSGRVTG